MSQQLAAEILEMEIELYWNVEYLDTALYILFLFSNLCCKHENFF